MGLMCEMHLSFGLVGKFYKIGKTSCGKKQIAGEVCFWLDDFERLGVQLHVKLVIIIGSSQEL